jgi:hypothetical protein
VPLVRTWFGAAERTTKAGQEVARVTDDADWTEDNATPAAPEGPPRCEGEFTTPRSLKLDNVPVPVSESRRVRNSLSVFGILERLVLVVSAAAITAFIIVATPPGSWNLWMNQRTADTSSANSQFPVQAVESATMPTASPAPTPAAVDQTTASSSSIRQLDRDEVDMLVQRGEEF